MNASAQTPEALDSLSTFESVNRSFEKAALLLGLSEDERLILQKPFREVQVEVPVRMDDGRWRVFSAYRVQHDNSRGRAREACASTPRSTPTSRAPSPHS